MKRLLSNLTDKVIFVLLIGIAALVWIAGPFLNVNNQYPLAGADRRFYLTLFLFLVWSLKFIFDTTKSASPKLNSTALTHANRLEERFKGAIAFLKKTIINKSKNIALIDLPWYLLIGPENAGKTTMLAHSKVNFTLTKQFKEGIHTSEQCDWWATRDLVIVDMPASYLKESQQFLWDSFLNQIKQHSMQKQLKAVVIALPLTEVMKQSVSQKKQVVVDIKAKITALCDQLNPSLNVYLVLTKCDLLPGFIEYFNEYGSEEISQMWGFPIPPLKSSERLLGIVGQRWHALIKRLNSQLILHLHQERNPNVRPAIKDFPLQVERLKEATLQFLKALNMPNLKLQGLYLTSALQQHTEDQNNQVIQANTQALQLLRAIPLPSKPYFIRELLLQGLLYASEPLLTSLNARKYLWKKRIAYTLSACTILTATVLLGKDFQTSILQTYAIQNNLTQYRLTLQQPSAEDHLLKALPLLNALQMNAMQAHNNLSRFTHVLSFYSDKSQKTANAVYNQALQTIVIPEIKNTLENFLHNNKKNPVQSYAVLKAYLMLGDLSTLQTDYIATVFSELLDNNLNQTTLNSLNTHIKAAFANSAYSLSLDTALIEDVRHQLVNLPSIELAFVILKNISNYNTYSDLSLGINPTHNSPLQLTNSSANHIPALFTSTVFANVMTNDANTAAAETLQGNNVLGPFAILSNEATIAALGQQVRERYITNYVDVWENLLANIKMVKPENLSATDNIIVSLMGNSSPLLQALKTIKENTSFEPILTASPKLQALNNLLANVSNNQNNSLYQVFLNLRELHFYLQNILSTTDNTEAAFEAAKNRMSNDANDPITALHVFAEQNPEPIKTWLHNLASESWYHILQNASQYIDNAWQVNVFGLYQSQIATVDPQERDLQQVVNFISKQGPLATFTQRYIKPFINDTNKSWQWRGVDNQRLPFSNKALEQLQGLTKLQNMSRYKVFAEGRNNPALQFQLPERL